MTANRYVGMFGDGNDLWTLNVPESKGEVFASRPELEMYLAVRGLELSAARPNVDFRWKETEIESYDVVPANSVSS